MIGSRSATPLRGYGVLFFLLYVAAARGFGQKLELTNQSEKATPLVVVIIDENPAPRVVEELKTYRDRQGTSLLIVHASEELSQPVVVDSINHHLNYTNGIDLQRCYLLVVGGSTLIKAYEHMDGNTFFSKKHFLSTDQNPYKPSDFEVELLGQASLDQVIDALDGKYLWNIGLTSIQQENVSDLNQNSIESGLLLDVNAVIPFYSGLEHSVKPFFRTVSVGAYHRWGTRWQTSLDFTLGLNLPSRNRLQNEIQPDLAQGQEVEVEVQAHVLTAVNLETRYFFQPNNKKANPYIGLRLGMTSIRYTEASIEIDPSSVLRSDFASQAAFADDFQTIRSPMVGFSTGWQMVLSPKIGADFGLSWNQDLASLEKNQQYFNNIAISAGVHFRFTGKKELFYDYIKRSK